MWKVEIWSRHVREGGRVVKPGRWQRVGDADDFGRAKQAVLLLGSKFGIARATKEDAELSEVCGMRADFDPGPHRRSFQYWTGSGGLVG